MAFIKNPNVGATISEKITNTRNIVGKMTTNIAIYATPNPTLLQLTNATNDLETAAEDALDGSHSKKAIRDTKERTLDALVSLEGNYVQLTSGGDANKILLSGFLVAKSRGVRIGALGKVLNVQAKSGTMAGAADTSCKKMPGAKSYIVQKSVDPITANSWTYAASPTKTKATIEDLPSLTKMWFRWCAVGAAGNGEWSDPAVCIIP